MKRFVTMIAVAILCFAMTACGQTNAETEQNETPIVSEEPAVSPVVPAVSEEPTASPVTPEEPEPNYAEIIPGELQGVWVDTEVEGILSLYAFKDNNIEFDAVNVGVGASNFLSGTYTVGEGKVNYSFDNLSESFESVTGYSDFTYEENTLKMFNANGLEIRKLTAADLMEYLTQEESSADNHGVICLADLIINYYPDSTESSTAAEKKDAANSALKAAGEAALHNLRTTYDKVQKITWYQHKNQPEYIDICCYIYPYIARTDDGNTWLRVALNYTDAQTDAGWIFFNQVIFSVDGENTTKTFRYNDIIRDNDTEVWETADFEPNADEIQLLRSIAASTETIIRFQGDEYYEDHVVTDKEKSAIIDVLTAYDYLTNYSE